MDNASVILAIETSLGPCSAAILRDGEVVAHRRQNEAGHQSRVLMPMIEQVLAQAETTYAGCGLIACTIGPGGFTGIRTGLATARAIALAAEKKLVGLSTLEVMAFASGTIGDVAATIDAHRDQWYVQRFRVTEHGLTAQSDALLLDERARKALAHGAKSAERLPDATEVGKLAYLRWTRGDRDFSDAPMYLRAPDTKRPANAGLTCSSEGA